MKKPGLSLLLLLLLIGSAFGQSTDERATFALTGDSIITQKLSVHGEAEFEDLIEAIRSADVAFTNLEMLFHNYEPYPAAQSGGTYMRADPTLLMDLVWAGFDMVSLANNHSVDYGIEGLLINQQWVKESGLVGAGVGGNLSMARAPGYLDSEIGRVALISCASTFPPFGLAGPSRPDVHGRPGLNPLRFTRTYQLDQEGMDALRILQTKLNRGGRMGAVFQGNRYELAGHPGVVTAPHEEDLREIAASIRSAKKQADWVLVSSHSHENSGNRQNPARFQIAFARASIDAGADIWLNHGPHVLRGIEIYKGRPIFYSVANFIFQNETVEFLPAENYARYGLGPEATPAEFSDHRYANDTRGFPVDDLNWQSVVAITTFQGDKLEKIELLPIILGQKKPRSQRGRPVLAVGEEARGIIEGLAKLSEPFGTKIIYRDGKGLILIK